MLTTEERNLFKSGVLIAGRYEVVRTLGFGGMGTVVQVVDHMLDGETGALKVLFPHLAEDEVQFARFRNEVILARRLSHPHIVRTYDFGSSSGGYYYISMEFVEKGSLTPKIYGRGTEPLTFNEIVAILLEICDGLSCAHRHGVIHRDLKPDNILISMSGAAKITDFGLARALDSNKHFTTTGETVGTPFYMSPEQLAGDKPDLRVDIYSLGILAFEMISKRRPYASENYLELAHMHMTQELPDICTINTSIPKWFKEFVETCASKRKEDRFSSADEAASFLLDYAEGVVKEKVFRVPAVLSMASGMSVRKRKSLVSSSIKIFKRLTVTISSLWLIGLILLFSPYGAKFWGGALKQGFPIDSVYPWLSNISDQELSVLVEKKNIKEIMVLAYSGSLEDAFSIQSAVQQILDSYSNPEILQMSDLVLMVPEFSSLVKNLTSLEKLYLLKDIAQLSDTLDKDISYRDAILNRAIEFNDSSLLASLLSRFSMKADSRLSSSKPLLQIAAEVGNIDVFKFLLERGADPSAFTDAGEPIISSIPKGSHELTRLLIQYGADPGASKQGVVNTKGAGIDFIKSNSSSGGTGGAGLLTRIRTSTPKGVFTNGQSGASLISAEVEVQNIGEEGARGVNVYILIPSSGKRILLRGPDEILRKRTAKYHISDIKEAVSSNDKLIVESQCSNCT